MSVPSTPSSPTSPPPEPYEVRIVTEKDSEQIIDHLRKFFFKDEPLNVSVKLIESDDSRCPELESYSIKSIKDGISLMAITDSNKIIGVCLNQKLHRDDLEEEVKKCPNPKFEKILKFLRTLDKEGNVFGQYPDVDKILNVFILSVDGSWRGKGIAKKLMDMTRKFAREQGYGLMRVDCSSHYSAKAVARLGFDCIHTIKYEDYKENGTSVFTPDNPHKEARIYVQRISSPL